MFHGEMTIIFNFCLKQKRKGPNQNYRYLAKLWVKLGAYAYTLAYVFFGYNLAFFWLISLKFAWKIKSNYYGDFF